MSGPEDGPQRARGVLVVIAGPSGVGKGTVVERLLERVPDAVLSMSATTRPPRAGEVDGVHYRFVSDDEFDRMVGADELLEWVHIHMHRSGTIRASVEDALDDGRVVLFDIDVRGALTVKELAPDALLVFLLPPSEEELERRLRGRGTEGEEEMGLRLRNAQLELALQDRFDVAVVNDDLERCVDRIEELIEEHWAALSAGRPPSSTSN